MLLLALLLAQAAPCASTDAALPPALAGWTAPGESFAPGKAVVLDTIDAANLKGLPAGTKPGKATMIGFTIVKPGIYGVALDQGGWIDVTPGAAEGTPLESVKHGHGPDCSSIRKIVRFDLAPGLYRLAVTGLSVDKVRVMLVEGE